MKMKAWINLQGASSTLSRSSERITGRRYGHMNTWMCSMTTLEHVWSLLRSTWYCCGSGNCMPPRQWHPTYSDPPDSYFISICADRPFPHVKWVDGIVRSNYISIFHSISIFIPTLSSCSWNKPRWQTPVHLQWKRGWMQWYGTTRGETQTWRRDRCKNTVSKGIVESNKNPNTVQDARRALFKPNLHLVLIAIFFSTLIYIQSFSSIHDTDRGRHCGQAAACEDHRDVLARITDMRAAPW